MAAHGTVGGREGDPTARFDCRLLVSDVDSTLIVGEVIEMIADRAGHRSEVERVTAAAMRGELDFAASLRTRVSLLAGVDAAVLDEIGRTLTITPGAADVMRAAQRRGVGCGMVSGGFSQVTRHLAQRLHLDFSTANTLEVVDGKLTGRLVGEIVDRAGKATALRSFARQAGVPLEHTVAIGDGSNDLDMMAAAGLSIAFNAKPTVAARADVVIDGTSWAPILPMLGWTDPAPLPSRMNAAPGATARAKADTEGAASS